MTANPAGHQNGLEGGAHSGGFDFPGVECDVSLPTGHRDVNSFARSHTACEDVSPI